MADIRAYRSISAQHADGNGQLEQLKSMAGPLLRTQEKERAMGVREILEQVDAQMKAIAARKPVGVDRRQQQVAVAEERRSGQERRGLRRGLRRAFASLVNAEGCGGSCQQGRLPCNCRNK